MLTVFDIDQQDIFALTAVHEWAAEHCDEYRTHPKAKVASADALDRVQALIDRFREVVERGMP